MTSHAFTDKAQDLAKDAAELSQGLGELAREAGGLAARGGEANVRSQGQEGPGLDPEIPDLARQDASHGAGVFRRGSQAVGGSGRTSGSTRRRLRDSSPGGS